MAARVAAIEKWTAVADICRCLHNFNGVLQICAAFTNAAVYRLKKTWDKVPKTVCSAEQSLKTTSNLKSPRSSKPSQSCRQWFALTDASAQCVKFCIGAIRRAFRTWVCTWRTSASSRRERPTSRQTACWTFPRCEWSRTWSGRSVTFSRRRIKSITSQRWPRICWTRPF